MLDILINWNRWGANPLDSGYKRTGTQQVVDLLELPEAIVLTGIRRSGKTTILYQVMDALERRGIPQKAMLYVNFEDPSFSNQLTPALLDQVYRIYREEVYPDGKAFLFFDEVQVVPEWERWVTARNETENIKILVSGSSAQIMSRGLATLLTGRHVDVQVHPLNFREFLEFNKIKISKRPFPFTATPVIQAALKNYLTWGGLPRVVLTENENNKRSILRAYIDDILFRDVALRHDIRNIRLLKDLAIYLLTQTSCKITFKRLAQIYSVSPSIIQDYCDYIEESFLISFISISSRKAAEINRNPKKTHCHDLGFRHIANMSSTIDFGKLVETCVYNQLNRTIHDGIYYWDENVEVDLVLRQGSELTQFIQVVYDGLDDDKILNREIRSLVDVHEKFPKAEKLLITANWPQHLEKDIPDFIRVIPLWQFLLDDIENRI